MTFVVVGHQRTGTTYLMNFVNEKEQFKEVKFTTEFFLGRNYLDNEAVWIKDLIKDYYLNTYDKKQIERKFNYFEILKEEGRLHPFKVIPFELIKNGYEKRLHELLDGIEILTIDRDPFDSFLSYMYQRKTNWANSHRFINRKQNIEEVTFNADTSDIESYLKIYKVEKDFISSLNIFHRFEYEELTPENMKNFFGIKNKKDIYVPMNINYRQLITNIDFVENKFKELYIKYVVN
jgi:hypothetical protein